MPDLTGFDLTASNIKLRDETYLIFKVGSTYYSKKSDGAVNSNSDFKTVFQAIIDSIGTRDDTVFTKIKLAPGTYDVNSQINIDNKYNLNVEGSGIGITRVQAGPSLGGGAKIFSITGSVSGVGKNLTANGTVRSQTVTMSAPDQATFSAGDFVLLRSSLQYGAGGSASGNQGEIKQVLTSAAGVLTFTATLYDTYNTANTANCIKLNFSKNITFSNFTLTKNASYADTTGDWWLMLLVNNLSIHDVQVEDFTGAFGGAFQIQSCINARINNCHLVMNVAAASNNQYGISFHSACQECVISNCTAIGNWRHPFEVASGETGTDQEGACRAIVFSNCAAMDTDETAFNTHPEGDGIIFQGCTTIGTRADRGFRIRCRRAMIHNCQVRGTVGEGIGCTNDAYDAIISNTVISECGTNGIQIEDGLDNISIRNCTIYNNTADGINIAAGSDRTTITGCLIRDNDGDGIDVTTCTNMTIANNQITGNGGYGLKFSSADCTSEIITANQFSSNTSGSINNSSQINNVETDNIGYVPNSFDVVDEFTCGQISNTATSENIGTLNWGFTTSGTSAPVVTAGVISHPGIASLITGATSGNNSRLHLTDAAATAFMDPTNLERYRWILRIPTITSVLVRVGIGQDISAANFGTAGAFFQFDSAGDTHWSTITRQASTSTTNNSTVTVTANNWYILEAVRLASGNWEFYINNTLAFTHSANQPTTACNVGGIVQTATTAARQLDIDYFRMKTAVSGQRFT